MDRFEQFLLKELQRARDEFEYVKSWLERAEREYKEDIVIFGKKYTSDAEVVDARRAYRTVNYELGLLERIYEAYKHFKEEKEVYKNE